MHHTMHLLPSVAKQPNLELKTWPKQLLGSLPLVIALPAVIIVVCPNKTMLGNIMSHVFKETRLMSTLQHFLLNNLQKNWPNPRENNNCVNILNILTNTLAYFGDKKGFMTLTPGNGEKVSLGIIYDNRVLPTML